MANINEILARAAALRDETALNSISPERAGGIMYDTLLALNELWLQQGAALVISKIYASVAAMEADTAPVSDLTGKPLRPGQIVVIASSDSDNGSVYRYNGTESPSWSLVGSIGNLDPVDSLVSDSTTLPLAAHQGKVLDGKISQLGQEVIGKIDSFKRSLSLTQGQGVLTTGSVLPVFVNNGEDFIVKIIGDSSKLSKVAALYICNSTGGDGIAIRNNAPLNTDLEFTANQDIRYLALYIDGSLVLSDQDISFECYTSINLSVKELQTQINETNAELHSLVPGVDTKPTLDSANLVNSNGVAIAIDTAIGRSERILNLEAGVDVYANQFLLPVKIKSGESFDVAINGDRTKTSRVVGLYATQIGGSPVLIKSSLYPGEEYTLVASEDIDYLSVYIQGTEIISNNNISLCCYYGITKEIEVLSKDLDETINGEKLFAVFSTSYDQYGNAIVALNGSKAVSSGDVVKVYLGELVNIDNGTYVYLLNGTTALSSGVRANPYIEIPVSTTGTINAIKFYKSTGTGTLSGKITIPASDGLIQDFTKYNVIYAPLEQALITTPSQNFFLDIPWDNVTKDDKFVLSIETLSKPVWAYLIYDANATQLQRYPDYILVPGRYVFRGFLGNTVYGIRLYCTSNSFDIKFSLTRLNVKERTQDSISEIVGDDVPVYYRRPATLVDGVSVNDYLYEKMLTISNSIKQAMPNGDAFVFITDIHYDNGQNQMQSPSLISYLRKNANLPRLFNGGDNAGGALPIVTQKLRKAMGNNKVYTSSGNHDYMNATYGDIFFSQRMFAEVVYGGDNKNYFYTDNVQQQIRYVVLSAYGPGTGGSVTELIGRDFDEEQFDWFEDVALSAPVGYSIIVFVHNFYGIALQTEVVSLDEGPARYVDAINTHNSTSTEKVIAVFCGHAHRDRIINLSSVQSVYQSHLRDNSTVPCIITTCDKNVPYGNVEDRDMNITDRAAGTIREQAFDVVVIDKTNHTIKCIRIGCEALDGIGGSSDRTAEQNSGDPVEIREVTYPI